MAVAAQIFVDLDSFSASAPYPLTLSGDGDGATPDVVLEGELPHGGRYLYSLELEAQRDYRFTTSGVADGFTERALLVDRGTGQVLWANAAAALELGLDADSAARFEAGWLRPEAPAGCLLSIWSDPAEPADPLTNAVPFLFEVYVDPVDDAPHTDDAVYRFFDPARGIERFTASEAVRDELLQAHPELRYDGVAFIGDDQAREGWVGVHEVLDHATGRYHYTTSAEERDALLAGLAQAEDLGVAFHVPGEPGENTQPVYRLFNPDSGTWFLTADAQEQAWLLALGSWVDQGVAFDAWVPPAPVVDYTDDAVYRFFDPARGIERFTASEAVRDELLQAHPELRFDGVAFIGDDEIREGWVGVHEVLDRVTGRYHYTASTEERDALLAGLAQAEDLGVAFHVPGEPGENTQPVYRMLDLDTRTWFLTADPIERLYLVLQGNWSDQGVAFNAWAPPAPQEPGVQPADAPAEPSALPQDATQDVSLIGLSGIDAPLL